MFHIEPFVKLGAYLRAASPGLEIAVRQAARDNPWFTPENAAMAIDAVCLTMTSRENLERWTANYAPPRMPRNVGVIMAGNIPLAGFFDLMCVLVSGHRCYIKPSSKDSALIEYVTSFLSEYFDIEKLTPASPLDAVIATGSDNTNRYFRSLYADIPHLLRKSRTSIAVVGVGDDITPLAKDVFAYFGMGCRSVSRIFVPRGYDPVKLCNALSAGKITFEKYLNVYRQNRAVLTMRGEAFIDGGFFTLRESAEESENIADIIYSHYDSLQEVSEWIALNDSRIQCIATNILAHPRRTAPGRTQYPELWDYPDGEDTLKFLSSI